MSVAFKCDCCGKYFDKNEKKLNGGNCEDEEFGVCRIVGEHNFYRDYHLCDYCVESLLEFLNDDKRCLKDE